MSFVFVLRSATDVLFIASNFLVVYTFIESNQESLKIPRLQSYSWLSQAFRLKNDLAIPVSGTTYYTVSKMPVYSKYSAYLKHKHT